MHLKILFTLVVINISLFANPYALPIVAYTACNKPITIDVMALVGNKGKIVGTGIPRTGTVRYRPKTITYWPTERQESHDTFTYTIEDGSGHRSSSFITVTKRHGATPLNIITSGYDTPLVINSVGNECSLQQSVLLGVSRASNGKVQLKGKNVLYMPEKGFIGQDAFSYALKQKDELITVPVTVKLVPLIPDVSLSCSKNSSVLFVVLAPQVDQGVTLHILLKPNHGTVKIAGNGRAFLYKPHAQFIGKDKFIYTVTNGPDQTSAGVVSLDIG